jgi:Ca2+-binding RTX toxin-like protein
VGVEGLTLDVGTPLGTFASAVLTGSVQNLTLTGAGALNVTGNTAANSLVGNAAANTLTGNDGDDVLTGGDGTDTLQGGLGVDVAVFSGNLAAYTVTPGATGAFTVQHISSTVTDTLTDIEVLKFADKYLVTATQSLQYTIDKADNNSIIEVLAADHSATAVTVNNKSLTIQGPAAITAAESDHARLPQITKSGTGTLTLDKVWIKGTSGVGLVLTGGDVSLTNSVVSVSATTGDPVGVSVGTGFGNVTVTGSKFVGFTGTGTSYGKGMVLNYSTSRTVTISNTTFDLSNGGSASTVALVLDGYASGLGTLSVTGNTFTQSVSNTAPAIVVSGSTGGPLTLSDVTGNFFTNAIPVQGTWDSGPVRNTSGVVASLGSNTVNSVLYDTVLTGTTTDNGALNGTAGKDFVAGQEGNDTITGGDSDDYLMGNAGNDTLSAGTGSNTVVGGTGTDTVVFEGDYGAYGLVFSGTAGSEVLTVTRTGASPAEVSSV